MKECKRKYIIDGKTVELSHGDFSKLLDYQDEFCRMSRRPGIGRRYFDEHKEDMYKSDSLYVKTAKGLKTVKPCRYYDNLYDIEKPEIMAKIKQRRKKVGQAATVSRRERSSLTDEQYLEQKENAAQERVKKLKREVE